MYPPHMSAPTPAPSYPLNPVSQASKSFLTPLRKHHKLLKDGSGLEVWPEFVEQIFVQGLQAYSSTTASYNHSVKAADSRTPGRSRLRNAFLVSYLKERGIIRSRKQVASHLQVLKNMWKVDDNPNYYLVAGSEPLSPPLGHSSISENASTANHIPSRHPSPAFSSTSSTSSSSSSPSCMMGSPGMRSLVAVSSAYSSPCSSLQSSPLETQQSLETGPVAQLSQRPSHSATASMPARSEYLRVPMTTARQLGQAPIDASGFMSNQVPHSAQQQCNRFQVDASRCPPVSGSSLEQAPVPAVVRYQQSQYRRQQQRIYKPSSLHRGTLVSDSITSHAIVAIPTKLFLYTEGMEPLNVDLEQLFASSGEFGIASLRLQLDVPRSPTLSVRSKNSQGFAVQVLANLPAHMGGARLASTACKCVTQVWGIRRTHSYALSADAKVKQESFFADDFLPCQSSDLDASPLSCLAREEGVVDVAYPPGHEGSSTSTSSGSVLFTFPNSALSTCGGLEQGATLIHQELSCSGQAILHLTYSLRSEQLPAARLIEWGCLPTTPSAGPLNWSYNTRLPDVLQQYHPSVSEGAYYHAP